MLQRTGVVWCDDPLCLGIQFHGSFTQLQGPSSNHEIAFACLLGLLPQIDHKPPKVVMKEV